MTFLYVRKVNILKKKLLSLLLCFSMTAAMVTPTYADEESDLREQAAHNSAILNETVDSLNKTQDAQDTLTQEISDLDTELVNLMSNISLLEADIVHAEELLDEKIIELGEAQNKCDTQYSDMKTRIQYIYEKDASMTWISFIAEANSIEDFLNRVFYTQELNEYDRRQLTSYKETVTEITEIKENLEYKEFELNEEKNSLQAQQEQLNVAMEEKKQQSSDYEAEIAALKAKADGLTAEINAQNDKLMAIQEEKRRAAEEEARKQAEEQARKDAEEEARKDQESQKPQPTPEQKPTQQPQPTPGTRPQPTPGSSADALALANAYASGSPYYQRVVTMNSQAAANQYPGIGQDLVNFAVSWVGVTPYVVAGESLTSGADCAGFVKAVYANYGVYLERNLELYHLLGREVSYGEMQPGDLILYWAGGSIGHVAIYVGNNTVVNASDPSVGTILRSPANYRSIASIRRIFCY